MLFYFLPDRLCQRGLNDGLPENGKVLLLCLEPGFCEFIHDSFYTGEQIVLLQMLPERRSGDTETGRNFKSDLAQADKTQSFWPD